MDMRFSTDELVPLIRRYYPSELLADEPGYSASEEALRLRELVSAKDVTHWKRFIGRLFETFPGCEVEDMTRMRLRHDPCYGCRVTLTEVEPVNARYDEIVCLLSQLAPVYCLYACHWQDDGMSYEHWTRYPPLPPEFQAHEAKLATLVESTFGATRLPNEVLFTPLPDIHSPHGNIGGRPMRLVDCLFTSDRR